MSLSFNIDVFSGRTDDIDINGANLTNVLIKDSTISDSLFDNDQLELDHLVNSSISHSHLRHCTYRYGTIDTSDITVGSGKTLDVSSGTLTLANNQISGDNINSGTIDNITITNVSGTSASYTNASFSNINVSTSLTGISIPINASGNASGSSQQLLIPTSSDSGTLTFVGGTNITLTLTNNGSGPQITINYSGGGK